MFSNMIVPCCCYCSLTKERPQAEHLTKVPKQNVGALLSVSHVTTKVRPCHVDCDLVPSKQIIRQTIPYSGTASGIKVKSWQHTILWMAPHHHEDGVAHSVHHISHVRSTQRCLVVTFGEVLLHKVSYLRYCAVGNFCKGLIFAFLVSQQTFRKYWLRDFVVHKHSEQTTFQSGLLQTI